MVTTKKVLIVDDSAATRLLVRSILIKAGFEVVEAADGHEGLDQLDMHWDITLVFCDVKMPRMNGLDMLVEMRATGRVGLPPLVLLTSDARSDVIDQARRRGANGWLTKPFTPDRLVAVARKLTASPSPRGGGGLADSGSATPGVC